MDNSFELIDNIIKSRLLAYSDEGYVDLLEKDVDSFRKRDRYASEEELEPIMDNLREAFEGVGAFGPEYMIRSYITASDAFNLKDFDWGKNKQLSSRKKFCRWMFRQAYMNNPDLYDSFFSPKKEDWELFRCFKPNDDDAAEEIDIVFTMLLTFQVIRPFGSDSMRALKYSSPLEARDRMLELLEVLQNDLPSFGINKHLNSIVQAEKILESLDEDADPLPPAAFWGMLNDVSLELKAVSSPAELLDSHVELNGYAMPGIWVDDAEDGEKRFWVFPNNKLMAFCFYLKNREWILNPYEFVFTKLEYEYEFADVCTIATTKGNHQIFITGKIDPEEIVNLIYHLEDRDYKGRFQTIRFERLKGADYPYWMTWRCFKRLPTEHRLTKEYMHVINEIYYGSEMLRGFDFRNIGKCITDASDSFVGLDSEFLYLSDISLKKDGYLERIDVGGEQPLYDYYSGYSIDITGRNLFSIEISQEQPMYVVSRDPLFYAELDVKIKKTIVEAIPNMEERKAFLRRYEDFKETVVSTKSTDQVTIYKDLPRNASAVLCFNKISRTFLLDEIIKWFGVRNFTSRDEMIRSDVFNWRNQVKEK